MGVEPTLDQEAGRATVLKTARPTGTLPPPGVRMRLSLYQGLVIRRAVMNNPVLFHAALSDVVGAAGDCRADREPGRSHVGVRPGGRTRADACAGGPVR